MPYNDWPGYKDLSRGISNDYNKMLDEFSNGYQNSVVISQDYDTAYVFPVALVVGLVVGGGALFCLIVMCCCCCKHTTRGRVLVPPPAPTTSAPPMPQVHIHQTYPGMADVGPSLYPEMTPIPHAPQPVVAPYKVGTSATVAPDYPPSYDTDRLLHGDGDAQAHPR